MPRPPKLGTVWPIGARLYDKNRKEIGSCMWTPNAVAKAFMECNRAEYVKGWGEKTLTHRDAYATRMADWNVATSCLILD